MKLRPRKVGARLYYQVDLGQVDGRRIRRTFKRLSAAKKFLTVARRERARHGARAFNLSEADRMTFLRAKARLRELGTGLEDVIDFFAKRRPRRAVTVADAIADCQAAKEAAGRRPSYLQHLKNKLKTFGVVHGDRQLASIEASDIENFLNGNGWAAATRRSLLIDLRTLFSWARKRGLVIDDPTARVEAIILDDKPPGILTVPQCRQLLKTALTQDAGLVPYLAIGLFCGVRPHELRQLSWKDVNLRRGHIEIAAAKAKSRRRRLVTISRNARAWLRKRGDLPAKNIVRRLERIRAAAGIPWPHDCLRHSFASYYLAEHGSADRTAHELGHGSTAMLYAHYRALVTPAAARQFWAITPENVEKPTPEEEKILEMPAVKLVQ